MGDSIRHQSALSTHREVNWAPVPFVLGSVWKIANLLNNQDCTLACFLRNHERNLTEQQFVAPPSVNISPDRTRQQQNVVTVFIGEKQ